jgi:mannan endo-1,4-beta-mannosidase
MAWELANEPRPMRPAANAAYLDWVNQTAALIKASDKNHLVTVGSEGEMGTEGLQLFEDSHASKNIDYLTIHIWPKNWGWLSGIEINGALANVNQRTTMYLDKHVTIAQKLQKPLVIEEFGLPRDGHAFDPKSSVVARDAFYQILFARWKADRENNGVIAGCNFWSFGGQARPIPGQIHWKEGDERMGDPPMEEQGLNTVFDSDATTWAMIRSFVRAQP